ncbi:MAG: hypothetical protein ACXABY_26780, partial [Candidatus Thorarchaeota archaeon]
FDKLDGSNIRAEWSAKRGFYKFGTRKRLLDKKEPILGPAVDLVLEKYGEDLAKVFKKERQRKAICFFEFHGPNSFAGYHDKDDKHTVTLFDANFQKGILEPREFLKLFGHLDVPELLYSGRVGPEFVEKVNGGSLEGMTFEGVVCKGKNVSPGLPLMFKIKNHSWYAKLRASKGDPNVYAGQDGLSDKLQKCRERIAAMGENANELLEEFDGWFPEVK